MDEPLWTPSPEQVAQAPAGARVLDTAPMTLDETHAEIADAHRKGHESGQIVGQETLPFDDLSVTGEAMGVRQ